MKISHWLGAVLMAGATAIPLSAIADSSVEHHGEFMIQVRATDVAPQTSDPILTAGGVDTGLHVHVDHQWVPTLGVMYFPTDHLAVELVLGITEHDIYAVSNATGLATQVKSTWVLPPVLDVQYHPFPKAMISPYLGAGVNLMIYWGGTNYHGFTTSLSDSVGAAVDFGTDVRIVGPWSLNLDAKKVWTMTHATIDGGALTSNVHLDPWILSVGFGRKF